MRRRIDSPPPPPLHVETEEDFDYDVSSSPLSEHEYTPILQAFKSYTTTYKNCIDVTFHNPPGRLTLDEFISAIEEYLEATPTAFAVILNHAVSMPSDFHENQTTTSLNVMTLVDLQNLRRNMEYISEMRHKEIFGDGYEGYEAVLQDDIRTNYVKVLLRKPTGHLDNMCSIQRKTLSTQTHTWSLSTTNNSEFNECFWDMLKRTLPTKLVDVVKAKLHYVKGTGIYHTDLPRIVRMFEKIGSPITIKEGLNEPIGTHGILMHCMFDSGHCYMVDGYIQRDELEVEYGHEPEFESYHIFAWDFETVCDGTESAPYMFSYAYLDVESAGENEMPKLVTGVITGKPKSVQFTEDVRQFWDYMTTRRFRPVSYNGRKFDNLFMLNILDYKKAKILKGPGNSIFSITYNGCCTFDLYAYLGMSLDKACAKFGVAGKAPLDKSYFEVLNEEYVRTGAVGISREMYDYSVQDAKCLHELWYAALAAFGKAELDMYAAHTLPGMCYVKFNALQTKTFMVKGREMRTTLPQLRNSLGYSKNRNNTGYEKISPKNTHNWCRQAVVGGRVFGITGLHLASPEKPIYVWDVVSLYPFVCMNRPFIYRGRDWAAQSKFSKYFIYKVRILKHPCNPHTGQLFPVIPFRDADTKGVLSWSTPAGYEGWCTGIDIQCSTRYGGEIQILSGWGYSTMEFSADMFKSLREAAELKKLCEHDDPMRAVYKMQMNCIPGKFGQKPYYDETEIKPVSELTPTCKFTMITTKLAAVTKPKRASYTGSIINSCLVYSYAREYMFEFYMACRDLVLGGDTDSLFTKSRFPESEELGGIQCEGVLDELLIGAKKVYVGSMAGKVVKMGLKGVGRVGKYNDDKVPSEASTWLKRCYSSGETSFKVESLGCVRAKMNPVFKPMVRTVNVAFDGRPL
jgi:hypothetical protein